MKKNILEWTVFAISLALILGVIGILTFEQVRHEDRPPALDVTLGEIVRTPGGYAVQVRVRNTGERTAEAVHIEVMLADHQPARAVLDHVPYGSERVAWVTFAQEPRRDALSARVSGYQEP